MFLNFIIKCCEYTTMMKKNKISKFITAYLIIGPLLCITGITVGLFQTDEFRYSTLILGYLFCVLCGLTLQILFLFQRNLLWQIINRILGEHSHYPVNPVYKSITEEAETRAEKESSAEMSVFLLSSSICVLCPYLYFITKPGIKLDHPDVQIIPYFYTIWKTNSIYSFVGKKYFEFVLSTASLSVYFIFTIFSTYTVANLEVHAEKINHQLNTIIDKNIKKYMIIEEVINKRLQNESCYLFGNYEERNRRKFEKSIDGDFVEVIEYLNFIHSYLNDVVKFLHRPMTAIFAWYISSTVLFAFSFITVTDDFIYIMKMLSLVIHCTIALRLYCNVAEVINNMNEKLVDSFYNTSWYYMQPKIRKKFSITLALCQKKYNVKCFGMYVANLNLFIFAVRTVYSVMNILLIMHSKK